MAAALLSAADSSDLQFHPPLHAHAQLLRRLPHAARAQTGCPLVVVLASVVAAERCWSAEQRKRSTISGRRFACCFIKIMSIWCEALSSYPLFHSDLLVKSTKSEEFLQVTCRTPDLQEESTNEKSGLEVLSSTLDLIIPQVSS